MTGDGNLALFNPDFAVDFVARRSRWLLQILGLSTPVPCDVILIDTQQTFSYTFSLRKFLTPIEVSAFHENRIYSR